MRLVDSLILCSLLPLTACGAGVIGGAIAGSDSDSSSVAEVQPSVTMSIDRGPLEIAPEDRYEGAAVLSNIDVPVGAQVVVDFVLPDQPEVSDRQTEVVLDQLPTGRVRWRLVTDSIRAQFADPTAQDVPVIARFGAEQDGTYRLLGEGVFTLVRKPVATVTLPTSGVIPITGGSLQLVVVPELSDAVQVEVRSSPNVLRTASIASQEVVVAGETTISVAVPAGNTPEELELVIVDPVAGRSDPVRGVFYAPDVIAISDRSGSTEGDELLSLIGAGLLPLNFDADGVPSPDFDRVEVVFRKGPREVVIDFAGFVPLLSTSNALTFRSPPSPDGFPGSVTIEARVRVADSAGGERVVSDEATLYAYAASVPQFEPRGLALDGRPLGVDSGNLVNAESSAVVDDFAVLYRDALDGIGLVRVLAGNGRGMLHRIGGFRPTGATGIVGFQTPIDLCVGDFEGDDFAEVVVAHLGLGAEAKVSTLRNDTNTRGLLGDFAEAFDVDRNLRRVISTDIDRDGVNDVFLAALTDAGYAPQNQFASWLTDTLPATTPTGTFTATIPTDLDQDGTDEIVCLVRDADEDVLSFATHDGTSLTGAGPVSLSSIIGPDERVTDIVGLSIGTTSRLGLVVQRLEGPGPLFAIVVVDVSPAYELSFVELVEFQLSSTGDEFGVKNVYAGDIDDDGIMELVAGSVSAGIRLYEDGPNGLELVQSLETIGAESVGNVVAIGSVDVAPGQRAVYVVHDTLLSTNEETRVTYLLIGDDGMLRGPKARRNLDGSVRNVVTTNRQGSRLLAGFESAALYVEADEVGTLTLGATVQLPGFLPKTMRRFDVAGGSVVAFLDQDSRFGLLIDGSQDPIWSPFELLPEAETQSLLGSSRIEVGDFDGDGIEDFAVLLRTPLGLGVLTRLVMLRGDPSAEFPFVPGEPILASNASSLAAGNFAVDADGRRDEIAIAIQNSGIMFYRYDDDTGALEVSQTNASQTFALSGKLPAVVRAVDLDQNGVDDLAVLSVVRSVVEFYVQLDPRVGAVNVAGFSFVDDESTPNAVRGELDIADVDGDGIDDFVVAVVEAGGRAIVGALLWDGADRIRSSFSVNPARSSGLVQASPTDSREFSFTVADTNRDRVPDLVIGWSEDLDAPEPSFLHTLFGSRR